MIRYWLLLMTLSVVAHAFPPSLPVVLPQQPLEINITGSPPFGYAILKATELSLAQSTSAPMQLVNVLLPAPELMLEKTTWATARLQTVAVQSTPGTFDVPVRVKHVEVTNLPATKLFVSNAPEKVITPRVLFEGALLPEQSVRLLYHHVNFNAIPLVMTVELLNPSNAQVLVQVINAAAGPSREESAVGHQAALAFLDRESRNAGFVAMLPPNSATTITRTAFPPGTVVSGLARFRVLSPDTQAILRLRAHQPNLSGRVVPLTNYAPSSVYGDFQFLSTDLHYHGDYTVGDAWLFVPLGGVPMPAERPGQDLAGSYGVTHTYELTARNPLDHPVEVLLLVNAAGGPARLVYSLGSGWRETGVLRPDQDRALTRFTLPPGASRTITLTAIPESGSNYPMRFIMRENRT